jgi:hypothetical protein
MYSKIPNEGEYDRIFDNCVINMASIPLTMANQHNPYKLRAEFLEQPAEHILKYMSISLYYIGAIKINANPELLRIYNTLPNDQFLVKNECQALEVVSQGLAKAIFIFVQGLHQLDPAEIREIALKLNMPLNLASDSAHLLNDSIFERQDYLLPIINAYIAIYIDECKNQYTEYEKLSQSLMLNESYVFYSDKDFRKIAWDLVLSRILPTKKEMLGKASIAVDIVSLVKNSERNALRAKHDYKFIKWNADFLKAIHTLMKKKQFGSPKYQELCRIDLYTQGIDFTSPEESSRQIKSYIEPQLTSLLSTTAKAKFIALIRQYPK